MDYLSRIRSEHTRRAYEADLSRFFGRPASEVDLECANLVSPEEVGSHIRGLRNQNKSKSSQRRRLSALRRFYDWLLSQGWTDRNPARACQVAIGAAEDASTSSASTNSLSKSELEDLMRATTDGGAAGIRDRAILLSILYGALRRSEVAAMNVEHVRPFGRHWVIDVPSTTAGGGAYVKIPGRVAEAIDEVQTQFGIEEGALWRSLSNRSRGTRMTPDAIYKMVRRTGERAGVGAVTIEQLRQSGLKLALQNGARLKQVQMHARLRSVGSVERYADVDTPKNRIGESAVDVLALDL